MSNGSDPTKKLTRLLTRQPALATVFIQPLVEYLESILTPHDHDSIQSDRKLLRTKVVPAHEKLQDITTKSNHIPPISIDYHVRSNLHLFRSMQSRPPSVSLENYQTLSNLHFEDLILSQQPTPRHYKLIDNIYFCLNRFLLLQTNNKVGCLPFGSYAMGLSTNTSDLDVCMIDAVNNRPIDATTKQSVMRTLQNHHTIPVIDYIAYSASTSSASSPMSLHQPQATDGGGMHLGGDGSIPTTTAPPSLSPSPSPTLSSPTPITLGTLHVKSRVNGRNPIIIYQFNPNMSLFNPTQSVREKFSLLELWWTSPSSDVSTPSAGDGHHTPTDSSQPPQPPSPPPTTTFPPMNLTVDLSPTNDETVQKKTEYVSTLISVSPYLKPLITIIKDWATQRSILDASLGYLNSFSLTIMVIFFLQVKGLLPVIHKYRGVNIDLLTEIENQAKMTTSSLGSGSSPMGDHVEPREYHQQHQQQQQQQQQCSQTHPSSSNSHTNSDGSGGVHAISLPQPPPPPPSSLHATSHDPSSQPQHSPPPNDMTVLSDDTDTETDSGDTFLPPPPPDEEEFLSISSLARFSPVAQTAASHAPAPASSFRHALSQKTSKQRPIVIDGDNLTTEQGVGINSSMNSNTHSNARKADQHSDAATKPLTSPSTQQQQQDYSSSPSHPNEPHQQPQHPYVSNPLLKEKYQKILDYMAERKRIQTDLSEQRKRAYLPSYPNPHLSHTHVKIRDFISLKHTPSHLRHHKAAKIRKTSQHNRLYQKLRKQQQDGTVSNDDDEDGDEDDDRLYSSISLPSSSSSASTTTGTPHIRPYEFKEAMIHNNPSYNLSIDPAFTIKLQQIKPFADSPIFKLLLNDYKQKGLLSNYKYYKYLPAITQQMMRHSTLQSGKAQHNTTHSTLMTMDTAAHDPPSHHLDLTNLIEPLLCSTPSEFHDIMHNEHDNLYRVQWSYFAIPNQFIPPWYLTQQSTDPRQPSPSQMIDMISKSLSDHEQTSTTGTSKSNMDDAQLLSQIRDICCPPPCPASVVEQQMHFTRSIVNLNEKQHDLLLRHRYSTFIGLNHAPEFMHRFADSRKIRLTILSATEAQTLQRQLQVKRRQHEHTILQSKLGNASSSSSSSNKRRGGGGSCCQAKKMEPLPQPHATQCQDHDQEQLTDDHVYDLFTLVYEFFHFYAFVVDFSTMGISVRCGHLIWAECMRQREVNYGVSHLKRAHMCIEDPFDTTSNTTRAIHHERLRCIQLELKRAAYMLRQSVPWPFIRQSLRNECICQLDFICKVQPSFYTMFNHNPVLAAKIPQIAETSSLRIASSVERAISMRKTIVKQVSKYYWKLLCMLQSCGCSTPGPDGASTCCCARPFSVLSTYQPSDSKVQVYGDVTGDGGHGSAPSTHLLHDSMVTVVAPTPPPSTTPQSNSCEQHQQTCLDPGEADTTNASSLPAQRPSLSLLKERLKQSMGKQQQNKPASGEAPQSSPATTPPSADAVIPSSCCSRRVSSSSEAFRPALALTNPTKPPISTGTSCSSSLPSTIPTTATPIPTPTATGIRACCSGVIRTSPPVDSDSTTLSMHNTKNNAHGEGQDDDDDDDDDGYIGHPRQKQRVDRGPSPLSRYGIANDEHKEAVVSLMESTDHGRVINDANDKDGNGETVHPKQPCNEYENCGSPTCMFVQMGTACECFNDRADGDGDCLGDDSDDMDDGESGDDNGDDGIGIDRMDYNIHQYHDSPQHDHVHPPINPPAIDTSNPSTNLTQKEDCGMSDTDSLDTQGNHPRPHQHHPQPNSRLADKDKQQHHQDVNPSIPAPATPPPLPPSSSLPLDHINHLLLRASDVEFDAVLDTIDCNPSLDIPCYQPSTGVAQHSPLVSESSESSSISSSPSSSPQHTPVRQSQSSASPPMAQQLDQPARRDGDGTDATTENKPQKNHTIDNNRLDGCNMPGDHAAIDTNSTNTPSYVTEQQQCRQKSCRLALLLQHQFQRHQAFLHTLYTQQQLRYQHQIKRQEQELLRISGSLQARQSLQARLEDLQLRVQRKTSAKYPQEQNQPQQQQQHQSSKPSTTPEDQTTTTAKGVLSQDYPHTKQLHQYSQAKPKPQQQQRQQSYKENEISHHHHHHHQNQLYNKRDANPFLPQPSHHPSSRHATLSAAATTTGVNAPPHPTSVESTLRPYASVYHPTSQHVFHHQFNTQHPPFDHLTPHPSLQFLVAPFHANTIIPHPYHHHHHQQQQPSHSSSLDNTPLNHSNSNSTTTPPSVLVSSTKKKKTKVSAKSSHRKQNQTHKNPSNRTAIHIQLPPPSMPLPLPRNIQLSSSSSSSSSPQPSPSQSHP